MRRRASDRGCSAPRRAGQRLGCEGDPRRDCETAAGENGDETLIEVPGLEDERVVELTISGVVTQALTFECLNHRRRRPLRRPADRDRDALFVGSEAL